MTIPQSLSNACLRQPANQARVALLRCPSMFHLKKKKSRLARPRRDPSPSPQLQSQSIPQVHERTVTRPILAWQLGMDDGSMGFKHTGHLLRRRQQSAWHDLVNLGQDGRMDGWLMQRGRDGRRAS